MNRYIFLLKNIGVLAMSQVATKLLSFFLVPVYTSVLSSAEYGSYDLISTTVNLMIPVITLNIIESIIVFSLKKNNSSKAEVISIVIKYAIYGVILGCLFAVLLYVLRVSSLLNNYIIFFIILLVLTIFNTVLCFFSRSLENIKDLGVSSVIASITVISLNIVFLLYLNLGLQGYFVANIMGLLCQSIYLFVRCKFWKYIKVPHDKVLEREMLNYSIPLIANSLAWWINGSSDRYVVTYFCGIAQNGIYSVGYKIPSILQIAQNIFNSAWTISAVKEIESDDKDKFFSNVYGIYHCFLLIICSMIIAFSKILSIFLFSNDFYYAWRYVPFLTIAVLFGSMSNLFGGVFSAVKDSCASSKTTIVGALLNFILNVLLVSHMGAIGAAISTMTSYIVVFVIRLIICRRYIHFELNLRRDVFLYCLLLIQTAFLFIETKNVLLVQLLVLCLIIYMLKYDVLKIVQSVRNKMM